MGLSRHLSSKTVPTYVLPNRITTDTNWSAYFIYTIPRCLFVCYKFFRYQLPLSTHSSFITTTKPDHRQEIESDTILVESKFIEPIMKKTKLPDTSPYIHSFDSSINTE